MSEQSEKAEVTMGRTSRSHGEDTMSIDIRTSGETIRLELSLADFTLALTSRGGIMAEMTRRKRKKPKHVCNCSRCGKAMHEGMCGNWDFGNPKKPTAICMKCLKPEED